MHDPRTVVDRQLAAYNARDLDLWLDSYATDAEQFLSDGTLLARGRQQLRLRMQQRFEDPRLRAVLLHRIVIGNTVVDHERVTRSGPSGVETVEMVCVYSVRANEITHATFGIGEPAPLRP